MQITRQRVRPVAVEEVKDICPTCGGTGKIEPTILLDKKIENNISYLTHRPWLQIPQAEGQPLRVGFRAPRAVVAAPALDVALQGVAAHHRGSECRDRRRTFLRQAGQTTALN